MKPYTPNRIPAAERALNVLYALFILGLGAIGVFTGELLLPGKRTGGPTGVALQGPAAWLMYAAITCAVCVLLASVVDHYDRRNNEAGYRRVAQIGKLCGWLLFAASLALYAFRA
jgi:hypothetical protein